MVRAVRRADPEALPALLVALRGRDDPRPEDDPPAAPPDLPTRAALGERFAHARARLDACAARSTAHDPVEPLLAPHYPLPDPIGADNPVHWFPALVNHLACLLFDAAGPALASLGKYRYEPEARDLVFRDAGFTENHNSFAHLLRDLRTTMQHGQKTERAWNLQMRERVGSWYQGACGRTEPAPAHARILAGRLMTEFERYLDQLEGVLEHLDSAPSSAQVRSQIARDLRVIDKDTFYELCQEAAERIDPDVDVGKPFENKYFDRLKKEMEAVCLVGPRRVEHAKRLIERYVAGESDRCPVDAPWLLARGVRQGPSLGRILKECNARWAAMDPPDRDRFIEEVARELDPRLASS